MDKNTIIGLLLIGALLIGFSMYNSSDEVAKPTPAKTETTTAKKEVAKVDTAKPLSVKDTGAVADSLHDAIEKEFGIDIRDRGILITDIETAFYIVMMHHDSI